MASNHRTLVQLATYKERENLEPLIAAIQAQLPEAHLLVIDDNSPDGTGDIADQLAARDQRIHVIHRAGKLGLGSAILTGLRYALEQGYEFVVNMDADFSHAPRYLPALLAGMDHYDVVIGSRYIPGGGVVDWDWLRKSMSWGINVYARLLLGLRARDTSGAYRCYRVAKLRGVDFDRVYSHGYSFQEEFLFRCRRAGCRIGETPIIFENRKHGKSKISPTEAVRALGCLLWVAVRR